jgi:aminopeptidase N
LRLDALESSQPIDVPITSEKQVKEIFDNISYAKGCSVLRMLINYLGQDVYRVGIRKYLNKFLWRNADPEDLWSTLSEVSGKDVSAMMDAWTKKTGYPVVISKGSDASGVLQLTQRRFLSSGRILSDADPGNPVWHIPLDDGTIATTRQFSYKPYDGQVKLNRGQFGVFRVLYSDDEWHRICAALADRKLSHCVDRLALGNDAFALAKAGLLNAGTALSVIRALGHPDERDNNVWGEVASAVSAFRQLLFGSEFEDRFRRFAIGMFKPLLPAVSWQKSEGESANISLLRPIVISALCSFGDPETVAEARRLFQNDRQNILPDLRSTVYCAVVRSFNMVDEVIAVMRGTDVQEEQVRCLRALSCTRDLPSVQRVLSMALDTQVVRSQDVMFITGTMAGEWSTGRDQVWSWIQTNWAELTRRYAESGAILGRILQGSLSGFLSPEKLHEVKEFVAAHPIQTIEMTMRQTIEAIENGVAWKNRDFPKVTQWLSASGF